MQARIQNTQDRTPEVLYLGYFIHLFVNYISRNFYTFEFEFLLDAKKKVRSLVT